MSHEFVIRRRSFSAAHFLRGETLTVDEEGTVSTFWSEYIGPDDCSYPVTIVGEIRGSAESLEEARSLLGNKLESTLPILAVAANAAIADPLPVISHGIPLAAPEPFIAYSAPRVNPWWPPSKRKFAVGPTVELSVAVATCSHRRLLLRAMEFYRRAVRHFVPEETLLAGEFLFISAETLSRYLLESRAAIHGITPKNLARLNDQENTETLRSKYMNEIFMGDQNARRGLQSASNGFEHGYLNFETARSEFEGVMDRAFRYVREALLKASGVPDSPAKHCWRAITKSR